MMLQPPPFPASNFAPIYPHLLDKQPTALDQLSASSSADFNAASKNLHQANQQSASSALVKFFSLFGYLLAVTFVAVALLSILFVASSMRSSARAALKSLGNFSAFNAGKYKSSNRRSDQSNLHNKDLLVINNQNGHQFLYAPANSTKINSSASTHILSGISGQHQGTLHQIQQQQQQPMYSINGTLSNLSAAGAQSNNYYYGLMGLTPLFPQQQQQQQVQHHLSQHQLNQQQQMNQQQQQASNYHHQANKSTISNESSSNSTPSSSGVESGSTSFQQQQHQHQQQQQSTCLGAFNNEFNLMGNHMTVCGQGNFNQHQATLSLNAHYASTLGAAENRPALGQYQQVQQQQQRSKLMQSNNSNSMREHIYESVEDDKPYTARLLLPQLEQQFGTLGAINTHQQTAANGSRAAMTLSSRMLQSAMQQQQQQAAGKRMFAHQPAIIRDQSQAKTNIVCSQLTSVTPQRATEINKFQHDMMAIYGSGGETTVSSAANNISINNNSSGSSSGNSSACYSRADSISAANQNQTNKLSTDC